MIYEYSYEKGMKVLDLLKNNEIAILEIRESEGGIPVMEFKTIHEFPGYAQRQISKTLSEAMPRRLQLIEFFNNFIVTKAADQEIHLNLRFNAVAVRKCMIDYSYTGHLLKASDEQNTLQAINACLERIDTLLVSMGVSSQKLNVFRKEGNGKGKKYTPVTLRDFSSIVRNALEE